MTAALLSDLARAKALFQQRAIATHITGRVQPTCSRCGFSHRICECPVLQSSASPLLGAGGPVGVPTAGRADNSIPGAGGCSQGRAGSRRASRLPDIVRCCQPGEDFIDDITEFSSSLHGGEQ